VASNKSRILELVDTLIGSILQNNLYTDLDTYLNRIKVPRTPYSLPQSNVNDTRPLQFPGPSPDHPHEPKLGLNAKLHVFPPPIHDTRPNFLNKPTPLKINGTESESDLINGSVLPGPLPNQPDFAARPDPLNFTGPNPLHPHDPLVGQNPTQHVFPYGHDNRPDFLNPLPPSRTKCCFNTICQES
jgi:hypothetical protein